MEPRSRRTSILLAFKVLQFTKQLRRLVKPYPALGLTERRPCAAAAALARTSVRANEAKPRRRVAACRVSKSGRKTPKSIRRWCQAYTITTGTPFPTTAAAAAAADLSARRRDAQQLLPTVDRKLGRLAGSFAAVASDHGQFLKHSNAPIYEGCPLAETVQLLAAVQDALSVLAECRGAFGDEWLVALGASMVGLCIDESFVANYEHLLLRLQTELIRDMARQVFEEVLRGGYDKMQRKLRGWFAEFAAKPQPLSTSFPWTIKPSLAVLWGVCWMFYDNHPIDDDDPAAVVHGGSIIRVPLEKVLQNINLDQWDAPASSDYVELGRQLIGTQPQQAALHAAQQQTANSTYGIGLDHDLFQAANTAILDSDLSCLYSSRLPRRDVSQTAGLGPCSPVGIHPQSSNPTNSIYYCDAQQLLSTYAPGDLGLPPHSATTPAPLTALSFLGTCNDNSNSSNSNSNSQSWPLPYISPQDTSSRRHLVAPSSNPSILVTGAAGNDVYAPPHPALAAFDHPTIYQPEALPLLPLDTCFDYQALQFTMSDHSLSPAPATMQLPHIAKHERKASINSTGMQTPVSTSDPRSPLTPTADARNLPPPPPPLTSPQIHSRQISEDPSTVSGDEERRLNSIPKRLEEPRRNADGKMTCTHQDCAELFFERKCEWSKHMDKHDRPYKCTAPGCEKLQGFTYSGGLLRHEREVHKMHGGSKKALFCPFHDCKRSSGCGFTRKENLAEHIRRVHRRSSMSADLHGLVIRQDTGANTTAAVAAAAAATAPAPVPATTRQDASVPLDPYRSPKSLHPRHGVEDGDDEHAAADHHDDATDTDDVDGDVDVDVTGAKRKRPREPPFQMSASAVEALRAENKRLRRENEEKDLRLRSLELAFVELQRGRA